jgi:hypothetical protein
MAAFVKLSKLQLSGLKICLFIDGMDEYIGDHSEITQLFKTITGGSSTIKAVISSRPEPAFEEAFRKVPMLRAEDLTVDDMQQYINSNLLSHSKMQRSSWMDTATARTLVTAIMSKARGVFLWVVLVVRQLLECLTEGAYPEDLKAIIDSYPTELNSLFEQMLKRVKPSHRAEAFRIFQAIYYAQEVERRIPTVLRLSFTAKDEPIRCLRDSLQTMNREELHQRLAIFEDRLKSRCCGLLEVEITSQEESFEAWKPGEGQVQLLHRTVADFLREPTAREIIECETKQRDSEIYARLTASILFSFKHWQHYYLRERLGQKEMVEAVQYFLSYCQRDTSHLALRQAEYVRVLDETITELQMSNHFWGVQSLLETDFRNTKYHWAECVLQTLSLKLSPEPDDDPLLSLAARFGLSNYVSQKLETYSKSSKKLFNRAGRSLVVRLSLWGIFDRQREYQLWMIERILASGLLVNQKAHSSSSVWAGTAWQEMLYLQEIQHVNNPNTIPKQLRSFLDAAKCQYIESGNFKSSEAVELHFWCRLVELFIKFGADLNADTKPVCGKTRRSARETIMERLTQDKSDAFLTEDSELMRQSKSRVQNLLDQDLTSSNFNSSSQIPSVSTTLETSATELTSISHQISIKSRSKPNQNCGESPKQHRLLDPGSTTGGSCYRCATVNELVEMGFQPAQIFQAIQAVGSDDNAQRLSTWILDNEYNSTWPGVLQGTTAHPNDPVELPLNTKPRNSVGTVGASLPHTKGSKEPRAKQWNVVVGKKKASKSESDVIGAQWVTRPQKSKRRKSKKKESASLEPQKVPGEESTCTAGAIQLQDGTFTWFFEGRNSSLEEGGLSIQQKERLEELLRSFQL